jgi:RNA polymerase sigma-70 factor (ECF subfamily)
VTRTKARVFDEYLVASAKAGDRGAFGALVERWQRKLVAHAWRLLGDTESAREVVQEGWTEIVRGLGQLQDDRAFPAWAYRIVSRRCARHIAGNVRRRALRDAVALEPETVAQGAEIGGRDIALLRAAIRRLPAAQRAAIALFHLEDMSVAEVAVALDVPAGTVKTRLMHARLKLREEFGGEE